MAIDTHVKHPANVREFVRRLGERGRSAYAIRKQLLARGVEPVPSERTIMRWAYPDFAEVERIGRRRPGSPGPKRRFAWEHRLERMRSLRAAGLSFTAVASVMRLDFEDIGALSSEQVRGILLGRTSDRTTRDLLFPPGAVTPRLGRPTSRTAA